MRAGWTAALLLVACDGVGGSLGPPRDAGLVDARVPDVGFPDAAARPDVGVPDGGVVDSGVDAGPPALELDIGTLPRLRTCEGFRVELRASAPVAWSAEGELPPGVAVDPAGLIHGRPTDVGSFSFRLRAVADDGREDERSFLVDVERSDPEPRWGLFETTGAPGASDDTVAAIDVCGTTPGQRRTLVAARGRAPFTAYPFSNEEAFTADLSRVAVLEGTLEPLAADVVVFDLPPGGTAVYRATGIFVGWNSRGDHILVTSIDSGQPGPLELHRIDSSGGARIARFETCGQGCGAAFAPDGTAVATLASGQLTVTRLDGSSDMLALPLVAGRVTWAASGVQILLDATRRAGGDAAETYVIERDASGGLAIGRRIEATRTWRAVPEGRLHRGASVFVYEESGQLRALDLEAGASPRTLPIPPPGTDERGSIAPDGATFLVLEAGPETDRARLVRLADGSLVDLQLDGSLERPRPPARAASGELGDVIWRLDGRRVSFTGRYVGCGCAASPLLCPRVVFTATRDALGSWRHAPVPDVTPEGLENLCDEGLARLVALGSVGMAPRGLNLAVSRIQLLFYAEVEGALQVLGERMSDATSFFVPDRFSGDGYVFADRTGWVYVGGREPVSEAWAGNVAAGITFPPDP